jgi:signal transduction histidine kinase
VKTDTLIDTSSRCALTSLGITSLLAIAIRTRSGQIGIVVCEHDSNIRVWDESEVELLKDVADQIAIAIDQANLYEQSRTTATIAQVQAQQLEQALAKLQQTQAQLIQTEKMSGLGQLVAGVAHEINNPVNFIFGNLSYTNDYVQNLLRLVQLYQTCYPNPVTEIEAYANAIDFDFLAEDLPKILTSMKVGADRIRQIVLSLRNFSRLDEADMKLVNIHEGIDSTLLILQHRLKSKPGYTDITVIKDYGDLPLVECYAGQLNQVFMNILTNAIDAIEEASEQHNNQLSCPIDSTPYIKIQTQLLQPDRIVIQISDNGPGMTETVRARLFDPFFTTKPTGQGTGLGLSISYQIVVEKHKGMLHCESEPGKGALFWIEIPLRQSDSSS